MANYHYSLGPWQWQSGDEPGWVPPVGVVACVDLRSLPTQALAGSYGDRPYGFFATSGALGSDYVPLGQGDCREIQVTGALQDAWESLLGYRPSGSYLVDLLWGQLTQGSDPYGDTPTSPLMPTVRGALELHLAGHSVVKRGRFQWGEHPHTEKVRDVLHRDYRRIYADVAAGRSRPGHDRRVLDFWCEQYRLTGDSWRELVPTELRRGHQGRLAHQTVITDPFTRPDADALGTSAEGWSWAEVNGDTDIVSNQAKCNTVGGNNRADTDLSSADQYAQLLGVTIPAGSGIGPAVRFHSVDRTFYMYLTDGGRIFKCVTGTLTSLGSGGGTPAVPVTVKTTANGSSLAGFYNGTSNVTLTDTAITGNLRTGFYADNCTVDDFAAGDLSTQSLAPHYLHYARMRSV